MAARRKESPMNINETVNDNEISRITAGLGTLGRSNGSVATTALQERVPMLQGVEEIGEQNTSRFIQGLTSATPDHDSDRLRKINKIAKLEKIRKKVINRREGKKTEIT